MSSVTLKSSNPIYRHIRAYADSRVIGGASFDEFRGEWQVDWTFSFDAPRIRDDADGGKVIAYMKRFAEEAGV